MTRQRSIVERMRDEQRHHRLLFPELFHDVNESVVQRTLDRAAEALHRDGGVLYSAGLGDLSDDAVQEQFAGQLEAARSVFALVDLEVPPIDAWRGVGVNFKMLERAALADESLTLVAAPHGLGPGAWEAIFAALTKLDEVPLDAPGIVWSSEVHESFPVLDRVQDTTAPRVDGDGVTWTLRLIPADRAPQITGFNYSHASHPSLPEMLTTQLLGLWRGRAPLDEQSFTWIAGAVSENLAARHVYDASERVVRVSCREQANQGPHLGARPPVSGSVVGAHGG